jgi:hypothetical protein
MADWIRGIINFNVVFHAGKQDNSLVIYYPWLNESLQENEWSISDMIGWCWETCFCSIFPFSDVWSSSTTINLSMDLLRKRNRRHFQSKEEVKWKSCSRWGWLVSDSKTAWMNDTLWEYCRDDDDDDVIESWLSCETERQSLFWRRWFSLWTREELRGTNKSKHCLVTGVRCLLSFQGLQN